MISTCLYTESPGIVRNQYTLYLGQCKARPNSFHRVCFFVSVPQHILFTIYCGLHRFTARVHWPPMNKFVSKLHGYIVYSKLNINARFCQFVLHTNVCWYLSSFMSPNDKKGFASMPNVQCSKYNGTDLTVYSYMALYTCVDTDNH